ncbi:hypothetical protein DERF_007917 [Dermatophagoides farinae]|uniref:Uncharacterized protein n=1 Tax=Dermatophagoides farinae TaxID=6954 RepID=A0A922HZ75_DERFA|nr:hypothetical protein DERF_007917 [Dermatophagoides farinae]
MFFGDREQKKSHEIANKKKSFKHSIQTSMVIMANVLSSSEKQQQQQKSHLKRLPPSSSLISSSTFEMILSFAQFLTFETFV